MTALALSIEAFMGRSYTRNLYDATLEHWKGTEKRGMGALHKKNSKRQLLVFPPSHLICCMV